MGLLAASAPVIVVVLRFAGTDVVLNGDEAIFAMQARDAATGGFPTVGLYSRYGWSHPGPIAFYAFAPFQVFGATWGTLLGAAAWNVAALAVAMWVAARHGGRGFVALVAAAQGATWLSIGGAAALDPWTPNLAAALVIPLLVAAFGAALGDRAAVVALLVLGAIAPQVHVGYALVVVVVGLAALALARDRRRLLASGQVLAGAGVAVALWLPVALGELTGRTHNVRDLWRFFRDDAPTAGWRTGARVMAGDIGRWPSWLGGGQPRSFIGEPAMRSAAWCALLMAALGGAALVARRAADRRGRVAVGIAASGLLAGVVAGAQIRGPVFHYLTYWRAPLIMFALVAIALCLPNRRGARWARPVAFGVAASAIAVSTGSAIAADQVTRHGDEVGALLDRVEVARDARILVRMGDAGATGVAPGLVLWLEDQGIATGVDRAVGWIFGDRVMDPGTADEVWYALDNGWSVALLASLPGARVVAERTPFDPPTAARVADLQRAVGAQLTELGAADAIPALDSSLLPLLLTDHPELDPDAVAELAALNEFAERSGLRSGIVAFAAADAPAELPWTITGF